jgi:hypothetical protein
MRYVARPVSMEREMVTWAFRGARAGRALSLPPGQTVGTEAVGDDPLPEPEGILSYTHDHYPWAPRGHLGGQHT